MGHPLVKLNIFHNCHIFIPQRRKARISIQQTTQLTGLDLDDVADDTSGRVGGSASVALAVNIGSKLPLLERREIESVVWQDLQRPLDVIDWRPIVSDPVHNRGWAAIRCAGDHPTVSIREHNCIRWFGYKHGSLGTIIRGVSSGF